MMIRIGYIGLRIQNFFALADKIKFLGFTKCGRVSGPLCGY
jgi:hypothetical protein